jgi:ketosteroid isomerase-like protein
MAKENLEIVKRAIDAFSRGDAVAFAALTTPDLQWTTGLGAVEGEIFRGHEGVKTYFARLDGVLGDFRFLADEFCDLVDAVLVLGRLEGKGQGSEGPVYLPVGMIWDLRGGLIWRLRTYLDHAEALKVVGLAE